MISLRTLKKNIMQENIQHIQNSIEPLRQQIIHHKVYEEINDMEELQIFMQFHVYAVWDFMSLLKALQQQLTCVKTPWFPTQNSNTRYLINEIVLGEETDIDASGNRKSHFELYLDAMQQCGAATEEIQKFIEQLKLTNNFPSAYKAAETPTNVQAFVNFTFDVINTQKPHIQAAVFTFGREDLIPNMFITMVNDIHQKFPEELSIYKYYLERHIEVDGDHHSHLALEMTARLCGENETFWKEAQQAVTTSLQKRILLWDGAYEAIKKKRETT